MSKEYRKHNQLIKIAEKFNYGNIQSAAKKYNEYGFSIQDIVNIHPTGHIEFDDEWKDIALLSEIAMQLKLDAANKRYYELKNQIHGNKS